MTDWVRLWHDMPTDPKWRVIARKSGQPLPCVLSVFTLMLTNASANGAERGTLLGWDDEDAAAALDMDTESVTAIHDAMQGKVLDGDRLTGWERRQPKREDNSTERVKAYRERQKTANPEPKRDETQRNAPDTETEEEKKDPPKPPRKRRGAKSSFELPDWIPVEAWAAFDEMRRAIPKVPFTDAAKHGIIAELEKLRAQGHCPEKLLLKAVKKGWRSVFAGDDTKANGGGQTVDMAEYQARLARLDEKMGRGSDGFVASERKRGPPRAIGELLPKGIIQQSGAG